MKKVVIVMPQLWTGGIQKMNIELASHINDERLETVILSLYPKSGSLIDKEAEEKNVRVIYLNKRSKADLSVIGQIYRFMKEYKPDVVHMNQRTTAYAILPAILLKIKKRFYAVHSLADKDAKRRIHKLVNRFAFHHLNVVPIAISETCRESVSEVYAIEKEKIPCIYNGIDTKVFSREKPYDVPSDGICTFITCCAFRKEKNLPLLIDAFAKVRSEEKNVRLILLGDGEENDKVREKIRENKIEDCVELSGITGDVSSFLQRAQVYVLSSDWEGLPVSVLEAMSSALPVVSTRAGGAVDIVKDGINGFLVDVGSCDALAEKMLKLARNPDLRKEYSTASERLSREYSIEKCVEGYIRLYLGE